VGDINPYVPIYQSLFLFQSINIINPFVPIYCSVGDGSSDHVAGNKESFFCFLFNFLFFLIAALNRFLPKVCAPFPASNAQWQSVQRLFPPRPGRSNYGAVISLFPPFFLLDIILI
jgi:hypothetical protein